VIEPADPSGIRTSPPQTVLSARLSSVNSAGLSGAWLWLLAAMFAELWCINRCMRMRYAVTGGEERCVAVCVS
jgi:hypothetical protein